jgi:hypothetical protein
MIAFEAVTIGVAASAVAVTLGIYLRSPNALDRLGRSGSSWIDHPDDLALEHRPSEDEPDAPIPVRRLRGRPE